MLIFRYIIEMGLDNVLVWIIGIMLGRMGWLVFVDRGERGLGR